MNSKQINEIQGLFTKHKQNAKSEIDHINYLLLGVSLHLAQNDLKRVYYKCTNPYFESKPEGILTSPELLNQVS